MTSAPLPAHGSAPAHETVLLAPRPVAVVAPRLDPRQELVAAHHRGRMMVLAGPGTGKTTTLVESVLRRVEAGVPLERILILTFSRAAAAELRSRVTARLGRTSREPVARTFHSYAFGLLRLQASTGAMPAPRLLSAAEQDVMLRELLAGGDGAAWPEYLQAALGTQAFAGELRELLLRAVERGLNGDELARLGQARQRPEWVVAGRFLNEYQDVTSLASPGAWDPAELIRAAHDALSVNSALLGAERERRRHILVDEYQDTDPAQAELLELIAAGADSLVVVGDPDQAIYAFRGAESDAMREFSARSGANLATVELLTSRRCGATLLEAGRAVAARLPGPVRHRALQPVPESAPGTVRVEVLRSPAEEAAFVAATLRKAHLERDIPWQRMAVLVRSTRQSLPVLRRALLTAGVPLQVSGNDTPLADQPAVAHLMLLLKAVLDPDTLTEEVAEQLLQGPIGGVDSLALRRIRRELRKISTDQPLGLVDALREPALAAGLTARLTAPASAGLRAVGRVLAAGTKAAREHQCGAGPVPVDGIPSSNVQSPSNTQAPTVVGEALESVLWSLWEATRLADRWESLSIRGGNAGASADRDLDSVMALFDAAARFVDRLPQVAAVEFVEHLSAQQIPQLSTEPAHTGRGRGEGVQILTAHAAKGLEWDVVCVAAVQEGTWPDLRRRGSLLGGEQLVDTVAGREQPGYTDPATALADERRLFYVAVTRARSELLITAVTGEEEAPSRFLDEIDPTYLDREPARVPTGVHLASMVAQLRAALCDPSRPAGEVQMAAEQLARLAAAGVRGADPRDWWGLCALSTDEPVADLDRPVPLSPSRLDSLLRCEVKALLEQFGARSDDEASASLGTLIHEIAAEANEGASLQECLAMLDERWHLLEFPAAWVGAHQRQKARQMLALFCEWVAGKTTTLLAREEGFEVSIGEAKLLGRVDRIEADAQGRPVILDLKTGSTKPNKNEVPTHAQLGAYQVAVEAGAFTHLTPSQLSGGAALIQLGGDAKHAGVQSQPPLAEQTDPDWARRAIAAVAATMRSASFTATENSLCGHCQLKAVCPLEAGGWQVTS